MSENLMSGHFSGATSFMKNGYAIWRKGLDEEAPNPYAVQQGETYAERMFYIRSMHQLSAYKQFIDYLNNIIKKEADKERRLVEGKLNKLRNLLPSKQTGIAIERAIADNNFGLAYTLMSDLSQSVESLLKEMESSHFKDISHTSSFWRAEFMDYLDRLLKDKMKVENGRLVKDTNETLTIDSVVDDWINEMLEGADGVYITSVEAIRQEMKKAFLSAMVSAGINDGNEFSQEIFGSTGDITTLRKYKTIKTKKGKDKSIGTLRNEIVETLGAAVGRGTGAELAALKKGGKSGAVSFSTGTLTKAVRQASTGKFKKVKQKTDVISFETGGEVDLSQVLNSLYDNGFTDMNLALEHARDRMVQLARESGEEIFEVNTNVKGYQSRRDLQIASEGSFQQRTQTLVDMAKQADGIPALSMEKLIFMLNNTMDGCLQENRKEYIVDYIAAVCVAWMWDDYAELFSISEKDSGLTKVHMFASGGVYYSASQILAQTLDSLIKQASKTNATQMVSVQITPPTFDADQEYRGLKEQYPLNPEGTVEDNQAQLKNRWDAMRDKVAKEGIISIAIKQSPLEQLVNKLQQYMS